MAEHRFFFNPIRYTSLGLATTELPAVIRDGESGIVNTRIDRLVDAMKHLLRDRNEALRLGDNGRRSALERFNINRSVADWEKALQLVTS